MKKNYWPLIVFNSLYIFGFAIYYLSARNYEFLLYVGVLIALFFAVAWLQKRVNFSKAVLWMLSIWGVLHMLGGGLRLPSGAVLYRWVPFELYNAHDQLGEFVILKFDQILHFYIYFVISFVLAHLLTFITKESIRPLHFYFFVAIGSMGLSVVNELIEFATVVVSPNTGVGGYYNTLLDLVFNTLGAVSGAAVHFWIKRGSNFHNKIV